MHCEVPVNELIYISFFLVRFFTSFIGCGTNGANVLSFIYYFNYINFQHLSLINVNFLLVKPHNNSFLKNTIWCLLT